MLIQASVYYSSHTQSFFAGDDRQTDPVRTELATRSIGTRMLVVVDPPPIANLEKVCKLCYGAC